MDDSVFPGVAIGHPGPLSVVLSGLSVFARRLCVRGGRLAVRRRGAVMRLRVSDADDGDQLMHLSGRPMYLGRRLPALGGRPVCLLGALSGLIRPLPRGGKVNALRAILTGAHFLGPQPSPLGPSPGRFRPLVSSDPHLVNQLTGLVELNA